MLQFIIKFVIFGRFSQYKARKRGRRRRIFMIVFVALAELLPERVMKIDIGNPLIACISYV